MKKLIAAAACSVIALLIWTSQASAGIFNWGCGCCNKCGTFCVRPYNAFSPVCYGSVTCVGCNPLSTPGYGPNLAFHGSVCGSNSYYGVGSVPVMGGPTSGMDGSVEYSGPGEYLAPSETVDPATPPSKLPQPNTEEKKSQAVPMMPQSRAALVPPMNPMMNPYGMTPMGVPVWAMSNPYAQRMPAPMPYGMMPQANPYGQMPQMNPYGQMPQMNPYGQMPQMNPYGQMPQAMPNYGYGMPNMMNPAAGMPNAMPPVMPNAR